MLSISWAGNLNHSIPSCQDENECVQWLVKFDEWLKKSMYRVYHPVFYEFINDCQFLFLPNYGCAVIFMPNLASSREFIYSITVLSLDEWIFGVHCAPISAAYVSTAQDWRELSAGDIFQCAYDDCLTMRLQILGNRGVPTQILEDIKRRPRLYSLYSSIQKSLSSLVFHLKRRLSRFM